jgi:hypothetical protein
MAAQPVGLGRHGPFCAGVENVRHRLAEEPLEAVPMIVGAELPVDVQDADPVLGELPGEPQGEVALRISAVAEEDHRMAGQERHPADDV